MSKHNFVGYQKTLLTFAIPHRNNFQGLSKTVDSILTQTAGRTDFEIIICDNFSNDACREQIIKLHSNDSRIQIFLNELDLGYDANVDLCIKRSSGLFVWLLGSGDTLGNRAVDKVYNLIQSEILIANIATRVVIENETNQVDITEEKNGYAQEGSLEALYNSALSGNIVNRELWARAQKKPLKTENWCHAERILQIHSEPKNKSKAYRDSEIVVLVAREKNGWWNENSHSFLYNVLVHSELITLYSKEPSLKCYTTKASKASSFSTLFKATIKTLTQEKRADKTLVKKVEKILMTKLGIYLFYLLFNNLSPCFKLLRASLLRSR